MEEISYPRYRWFILLSMCVVQATVVIVLVCPATLIGEISKTMGIDMGMTTQITMVIINIFIGISAFLGGRIIDRFGAYNVWAGCSSLLIIGALLVPVMGDAVVGMLFIRLIHGVGAGPIMATAPLVAAQWFPPKERAIVIGFQGATVAAGAIVSLNFVPFMFRATGSWQAALAWPAVFAIPALILSLIVILGPKPPFEGFESHPDNTDADTGYLQKAYRIPATWAAVFCSLCFSWVVRIMNDLITNYLAVAPPVGAGLGPGGAGGVMSGVNAVFTLAALMSGFMLEKIFKGRISGMASSGFILSAVLWSSIKLPGVYSDIFILSSFLWVGAFGIAVTSPLVMTFFAKNYPQGIMGKLGGLIILFNQIGTFAGTAVGSLALSITGRYDIVIYILGAGAFMGFLSASLLKEPKAFSRERL